MVQAPSFRRIPYNDVQATGYMVIFCDVPIAVIARHLDVNTNSLGRRIRILRVNGWVPFPPVNALRLIDTFFFPGPRSTRYSGSSSAPSPISTFVCTSLRANR